MQKVVCGKGPQYLRNLMIPSEQLHERENKQLFLTSPSLCLSVCLSVSHCKFSFAFALLSLNFKSSFGCLDFDSNSCFFFPLSSLCSLLGVCTSPGREQVRKLAARCLIPCPWVIQYADHLSPSLPLPVYPPPISLSLYFPLIPLLKSPLIASPLSPVCQGVRGYQDLSLLVRARRPLVPWLHCTRAPCEVNRKKSKTRMSTLSWICSPTTQLLRSRKKRFAVAPAFGTERGHKTICTSVE